MTLFSLAYNILLFVKCSLSGIVRVCEGGADAQKAVQTGIKSVICSRATPRSISLEEGALHFGMDYNAANDADATYDYLMNQL